MTAERSKPAAVIIVAQRHDPVALRVSRALIERNIGVKWKTGCEAARLFTIRIDERGLTVSPDLPMFVRPSAWWAEPQSDPDARFLLRECHATFWAAAALCASPVLNRPGPSGTVGRLTAGALGQAEIHAAGSDGIEDDGTFWIEDADFRTGPLSLADNSLPFRARRVDPTADYEIVVVVGAQAFEATTDPRTAKHDLPARSLDLARRHHVQFAAITWEVAPEAALPVRLNPAPDMNELRYRSADVLNALCEALLA